MGAKTARIVRRIIATMVCSMAALGVLVLVGCAGAGQGDIEKRGECAPAFSHSYEKALQCMTETAGDAKLVAVRTSGEIAPGQIPEWMYLFASQEKMGLYTVFMAEGASSVAGVDQGVYSDELFGGIASVDAVDVDADRAYQIACDSLPEGTGPTACSAFLMLSALEEGAAQQEAIAWTFAFYPISEDEGEEGSSDAEPIYSCTVDAQTGEVSQIVA